MIKQIILPAFCCTHHVNYDRANRFGCVECYADERVADIDDDEKYDSTSEAKDEIKETFDARLDEAINQIMKHIDDCVDGVGNREELMGGLEAELKEFFDDCVERS